MCVCVCVAQMSQVQKIIIQRQKKMLGTITQSAQGTDASTVTNRQGLARNQQTHRDQTMMHTCKRIEWKESVDW